MRRGAIDGHRVPNAHGGCAEGRLDAPVQGELSTELGETIDRVNAQGDHGFVFDTTLDAPGHPQNIYCRSDHAMYARLGIPVAFFTTGVHPEYHQITDEVEYIDFAKLASVTAFIADIAVELADRPDRPAVDGPMPDPAAPCRQ